MLFSNAVKVKNRIIFSVRLVSGNAHLFILISCVIMWYATLFSVEVTK